MQHKAEVPLAERTAASAAWLVSARLITKGIDFVTLLILARLLNPMQFGIVAVAMTLIFIVEAVVDLPIHQVLVRLRIERVHLDTAFTISVLRGLGLALTLSLLAWPFSRIYSDPRLVLLISALSLAPALRGMVSPGLAIYAQALNYKRDFAIELAAKLVAFASSTTAALLLRDYRALVVGTIATPATMVVVSYVLAPHRPRFSLAAWSEFARFVGWSTSSQLLAALNWQCDRLVLGRYVSRAQLGEFSLANDLSYLPEQSIIKPIVRPLMAAFARINHDKDRLDLAYAKTATTVLAIGAPVMIGLSLLARPTVALALGGKWLAAIPILQWLPLTLIPALFIAPLGSLAMALGRPDIAMRQTAAESIIKLPLIFGGAIYFGVTGVIVARAVAAVCVGVVSLYYVRSLIGTPMLRQIAAAWRVFAGSLVLAAFLLLLRPLLDGCSLWELAVGLSLISATGMAGYLLTMGLCWHLAGRPAGLEATVHHRIVRLLVSLAERDAVRQR